MKLNEPKNHWLTSFLMSCTESFTDRRCTFGVLSPFFSGDLTRFEFGGSRFRYPPKSFAGEPWGGVCFVTPVPIIRPEGLCGERAGSSGSPSRSGLRGDGEPNIDGKGSAGKST